MAKSHAGINMKGWYILKVLSQEVDDVGINRIANQFGFLSIEERGRATCSKHLE
jgi:hypothetical protein